MLWKGNSGFSFIRCTEANKWGRNPMVRRESLSLLLSFSFVLLITGYPCAHDLSGVIITLERTMCFGKCPVYTLTIYGDGTVNYEGKKHVAVMGSQMARISENKVSQLIDEFMRINYFSLKDSYTRRGMTDMPSAITSIRIGGREKTVHHYYGDRTAPPELKELEKKIDQIAGSAMWVKRTR
jgi:hypothetical protein